MFTPSSSPTAGPGPADAAGADGQVRAAWSTRLFAWLNDPGEPLWERPGPSRDQQRRDIVGALAFVLVGLGMTVATKSFGMVNEAEATWRAFVAVAAMIAPLAIRRRFPLIALLISSVLFLTLSYLSPEASVQAPFQVAYFATLYAAVAWARDRRLLWISVALVLLEMAAWIVISFTISRGMFAESFGDGVGPLEPVVAYGLYTAVLNLAYFGGAILVGRNSWRTALHRSRLAEQAERIRAQSDELARRAVVDERLRIARELHDVVAHHISVIGIQAGAARRVLTRSPQSAEGAMRTIEGASREAVGEMRSLLGVLRSETETGRPGDSGDSRAPEPGLADLDGLAERHRRRGLQVTLTRVEAAPGDLDRVPPALGLSVYRCVQESLTNVARHSTAGSASVTLRTGTAAAGSEVGDGDASDAPAGPFVEVEVLDDGQPRGGTSGTGYGLRGVSERVSLHGGQAEIGPRRTGSGWRVRARFHLRDAGPHPRPEPGTDTNTESELKAR
ncbi:sensor histidine kinase [Occultella glacieicola]|uniref:histidine kinase n=1 Tax=Occultella glacieicola TaxID=2518684 RepID=A0ABY2E5M2_9MICO|nr:histidine kinase [Occultella glacieicola]TDE92707.1 sensor histidine kinase [Occultella glacieicola]